MALDKNAKGIITGPFPNLRLFCDYLLEKQNRDTFEVAPPGKPRKPRRYLVCGAVIQRIGKHFSINCDSSQIALALYKEAKPDSGTFMKNKEASHYKRLTGFGLEKDIRYCLYRRRGQYPWYMRNGKLIAG